LETLLSATSQQYFSLRTNHPPATSRNQPAVFFFQNKSAPATSQTNTLLDGGGSREVLGGEFDLHPANSRV
jgi:hypothetical protein